MEPRSASDTRPPVDDWRRRLSRLFRTVTPTQWAIDVTAVVVFAAVSFVTMASLGEVSLAFASVTVALMTGALLLSRASPPLALAVAWIGALWQVGTTQPPMLTNVAIFAVLFATAAYGSRLVFWLGFASAFVGALIIAIYLTVAPLWGVPGSPLTAQTAFAALSGFIAALFALLLSWTLGALFRAVFRARDDRRAQREAEERAAAEEERGRIARDMHDVVAHSLAVVIAQADGARYAAAVDPAAATDALTTISQTARSALADVRLLLTQLRHRQGDGPQPTLADLEQLYGQVRAAGVDLRVDVDPAPPGTPPAAVQLAVYRILQEALTNALRHGDGGPVEVSLAWLPDRVVLGVRNVVRVEARATEPGGHGVIGMRERAQLTGGRLDAGREGDAWIVRGEIPIGPGRIDG
ncbi:histidine kinase [Microbacterium sp.]|uniref:sensor histidine kinase n=1 Tax=Microbacterium sp. TaxID=51671 RepID=UPI0028123DED|nr:histidine kinase [Microbacterium sp.]